MTTLFRLVLVISIAIVIGVLTSGTTRTVYDHSGHAVSTSSGVITGGLFVATRLMILFPASITGRYPPGASTTSSASTDGG